MINTNTNDCKIKTKGMLHERIVDYKSKLIMLLQDMDGLALEMAEEAKNMQKGCKMYGDLNPGYDSSSLLQHAKQLEILSDALMNAADAIRKIPKGIMDTVEIADAAMFRIEEKLNKRNTFYTEQRIKTALEDCFDRNGLIDERIPEASFLMMQKLATNDPYVFCFEDFMATSKKDLEVNGTYIEPLDDAPTMLEEFASIYLYDLVFLRNCINHMIDSGQSWLGDEINGFGMLKYHNFKEMPLTVWTDRNVSHISSSNPDDGIYIIDPTGKNRRVSKVDMICNMGMFEGDGNYSSYYELLDGLRVRLSPDVSSHYDSDLNEMYLEDETLVEPENIDVVDGFDFVMQRISNRYGCKGFNSATIKIDYKFID